MISTYSELEVAVSNVESYFRIAKRKIGDPSSFTASKVLRQLRLISRDVRHQFEQFKRMALHMPDRLDRKRWFESVDKKHDEARRYYSEASFWFEKGQTT